MSNPERFEKLSVETASPAIRPALQASAKSFGFLPSPVARAAHSPALLRHLLGALGAFDAASSLTALEREVVALSVAFEMGCHYCMALHSALLARQPEHAALLEGLRAGTPLPDARLETLRELVRALVGERGRLSGELWSAAHAAGFDRQQVLEVVLGTGVYLLSTLTNIVTEAELDAPFEPFRWSTPSARTNLPSRSISAGQ